MVNIYKIGSQITLQVSTFTLVLSRDNGNFNGQGYVRREIDDLTTRVSLYTPQRSAVIEGTAGDVHEFLFDLNLRRTEWRTLWRMWLYQQQQKEGIILIDQFWPYETLSATTYQSFLVWIDQPPIEIAGGIPNTNAGTGAGDCAVELLHRVAFRATEIP